MEGEIPTIFEDDNVVVRQNGSSEVFVTLKVPEGPTIRVTPKGYSLMVTAAGNVMSPYSHNGLPCFYIASGL